MCRPPPNQAGSRDNKGPNKVPSSVALNVCVGAGVGLGKRLEVAGQILDRLDFVREDLLQDALLGAIDYAPVGHQLVGELELTF